MLYLAKSLQKLRFGDLMEVYIAGNLEKAGATGLLQAEQDFYQYLAECFFMTPGALYAIWSVENKYVSALRLEPFKDGLLLAALETAPQYRRRGYAKELINAVLAEFTGETIYAHVSKTNTASLAVHKKCGFCKVADSATYIDGSVDNRAITLCHPSTQRGEAL